MLKYRNDCQEDFNTAHRAATLAFQCWDKDLSRIFAKHTWEDKTSVVWVAGVDLGSDAFIRSLDPKDSIDAIDDLPIGENRGAERGSFCYDWNALLAIYDAANVTEQERLQAVENKRASQNKI
jgi:hypothetical protein